MKRRDFIRNSIAGAGALFFSGYSPFVTGEDSSAADSRIEILLGEPLGVVSPNIYGHFTENLSGVIYDGVWVGENSKVPNVNGIRKELVDEMAFSTCSRKRSSIAFSGPRTGDWVV